MAEFLTNAYILISFAWLIILGERIDALESSNGALKRCGLALAKEIDRLRARVKELEENGGDETD